MNTQTANAILMQQQQQRRAQRGGSAAPTVIPHNSPNVESNLLCNYSQYLCKREKVHGHDYCTRHILEDKNSAYKQCNFQYRTHRRCPRPALKTDRKDGANGREHPRGTRTSDKSQWLPQYCSDHTRKAMVARQKAARKRPHADPVHRYLDDLAHYKQQKPEIKTETAAPLPNSNNPTSGDFEDLEKDITPFQIATNPPRIPSPPAARVFDFGSDESDNDSLTVETTWKGDQDSDADSVDSELDNPLKHAGAYSAEEVIRIMRDKLIRLQKLYIDQFQRLQYLLKEERRQYRNSLRKEHEADLMSIQRQPKETIDDKIAYEQLKALNHYNKPAGMEAFLHAKLMERRIRLSEANNSLVPSTIPGSLAGKLSSPSPILPKCSFNITSSTKCGDIAIPMTKYCQKHILNDPNQVLFRQCGTVIHSEEELHNEDGPCETPIPDVLDTSTCVYHVQFQPPLPTSQVELDPLRKTEHKESIVNTSMVHGHQTSRLATDSTTI